MNRIVQGPTSVFCEWQRHNYGALFVLIGFYFKISANQSVTLTHFLLSSGLPSAISSLTGAASRPHQGTHYSV